MLLLDVDHFKKVNDTHGHLIGDEVLRSIAETLARDVRLFDGVFRFGGEEFAVILYGADVPNAAAIAERLREATAAKVVTAGSERITATVSIGVAAASKSSTPESLVADADAALYRAKSEGRNRVVLLQSTDRTRHVA
jgi:diguanylate cyclase